MKILGSPIISLMAAIIFIIFLLRYWKLLKSHPLRFRILLISLRTATIIALLLLLINPWVAFKQKKLESQKVEVIFDLSESMLAHFNNSNIQPDILKKKISSWGTDNQLDIEFHRLGKKINLLQKMTDSDKTTDFSNLSDFIAYKQPDQVLLITDGKATVGREMDDLKLMENTPVHILGVGPLKTGEDLAINRIEIPSRTMSTDTVILVIRLQSRITKKATSILQILNEEGNNIFNRAISFDEGVQKNEMQVSIPAMNFNGLNTAKINPINGETQIKNNQYSFRVNVKTSQDNILLISGALSTNTNSIKSILQSLEESTVNHYYRFDPIQWNEEPSSFLSENPKIIVLDDFPSNNYDKALFNEIVKTSRENQISIIYFEGPKSNLSTAELIRTHFPYFVPTAIDSDILTPLADESSNLGISGINLSAFPPQRRSVKWTANTQSWVNYSDGSFMIADKNNNFMVTIPDIAGNHLKTSVNFISPIYNLIRKVILHAFYGNDGFLTLHINGISYNKGEVIEVQLLPIEKLGLSNFTVTAANSNLDTIRTDCRQEIFNDNFICTLATLSAGEYNIKGMAVLPDGKPVVSNETSIVVQDINIELRELIQDQNKLMRVAHNTGGVYMPIESLDSMFSHIDITPVQFMKNHQISGLSTQNYWWMLIIFLSIEWFVRKKLGLL